jgi:PTH1 family peptidyl-tRNA hydrolase
LRERWVRPDDAVVTSEPIVRPEYIVGFGNPGAEYASTRHNVGTWLIRVLARRHKANFERHGKMETAQVEIGGRTVYLGRPRAYVNESGPPIAAELRRLKIDSRQLLAIYDDIDLPVGQIRIRALGGHGGYNGMKSLLGAVATQEFPRIRIGIDRPYDNGKPVRDPDRVADWVLHAPSATERKTIEDALEQVADAVELAVSEGIHLAMNRYNPAAG